MNNEYNALILKKGFRNSFTDSFTLAPGRRQSRPSSPDLGFVDPCPLPLHRKNTHAHIKYKELCDYGYCYGECRWTLDKCFIFKFGNPVVPVQI